MKAAEEFYRDWWDISDHPLATNDLKMIECMEIYAKQHSRKKDGKISKLKFMIDNGLGWKDMEINK